MKREIDKSSVLSGDFNILASAINGTSRQYIGKDMEMNNTINQLHKTDIYRTFYLITTEYILFPKYVL